MKKPWAIVNIVLALAIVTLYIFYFTGKSGRTQERVPENDTISYSGDFTKSIYYINFDTVLAYFNLHLDLQDQLERKAQSSEAELTSKGQKFQRDVAEYQNKVQKGLLLRSEAQEVEQELAATEQQLMRLQENKRTELAQEQVVANRKVLDAIMTYLEKIQPRYNYHFVLGASFGGGVLYANKSLDITWEVINGLNTEYKKERDKNK